MPDRVHEFRTILVLATLALLPACRRESPPAAAPAASEAEPVTARFDEIATSSGVDFRHRSGATGELLILEIMGAGSAAFDCDADGDLDILLRQNGPVPGGTETSRETDRLFRNDTVAGSPWKFTDVTAGSGLDRPAYGMGVTTGDYDGDGFVDLYLTNFGANRLLRGLGDCRFADETARAGVGDERWGTAASFFDLDGDGDLDLFVGNYVKFSLALQKTCFQASGAPDYCGPESYEATSPRLFVNRGDGTFADGTTASGMGNSPVKVLGSIAADFDGDGRIDLFVANDAMDNYLWHNRGDGTFEESAKLRGVALNAAGLRTGDMGVDAADFDGDGDFDLVSTHLSIEGASLWRNDGKGNFWDSAASTGTLAATMGLTGFGARWFDADLDSKLELLVANGGVRFIDRLVSRGTIRTLEQNNLLLRFEGGRLRDIAGETGTAFSRPLVNRGLAVADFDNDGDSDLLISTNDGPAQLLENRLPATGDWIGIRLLDRSGRRDALGAVATLELEDGTKLVRRSYTDGSYLSASDARVVFGLVKRPRPNSLVVRWPGGLEERFPAPATGSYVDLREGTGTAAPPEG